MTKIVINKCHGGFGLSHEATLLYFKLKGWECYPEKQKYVGYKYWKVPADMRSGILSREKFLEATSEERKASNMLHSELCFYDGSLSRDDLTLVEVVETLGTKKASDTYSELIAVEIPDDVEWEIEEYDGREWVAEVHRTWS